MKREKENVYKPDKGRREFLKKTLSISALSLTYELFSPFLSEDKSRVEAGPCCYSNCHGARGRR